MLDHHHNASSARHGNWGLYGLGSTYGLQTYPSALHRGYGWGRMMDADVLTALAVSAFHKNAMQTTSAIAEQKKIQYPLSWR